MRHFLNMLAVQPDLLMHLLAEAARMKRGGAPNVGLAGKFVALVFEKPSLRTRVSFEAGVSQLGGTSMFQQASEIGLGVRETVPDFARTMSQYVNCLVMRVFSQDTVAEVARHATVPVVNALSDRSHPCQALADLQTIAEIFGELKGRHVAFVGDGNNVSRSLAVACAKAGMRFTLACPERHGWDDLFIKRYRESVAQTLPPETHDPCEAVRDADVIYTDVWTSMGQEAEAVQRRETFKRFQVNEALLARAPKHAKVMHCLPAHRGEEITHEVMESPASVVFQQAQNRLHAQKAILEWLMGAG